MKSSEIIARVRGGVFTHSCRNVVIELFAVRRPFVIGRKNWLFSDTPKGAMSSAVETAKANGQEPYAWLRHALERLPTASSVEDYEALLPWNCSPVSHS